MHTLHTVLAAIGCGVLWLLGELFGELLAEVAFAIVTLPFRPVHWVIVNMLSGAHRMAWLRTFIGLGVVTALAGVMVIAASSQPLSIPGSLMIVAAVLALIEVDRAWKEAREFLALRYPAS